MEAGESSSPPRRDRRTRSASSPSLRWGLMPPRHPNTTTVVLDECLLPTPPPPQPQLVSGGPRARVDSLDSIVTTTSDFSSVVPVDAGMHGFLCHDDAASDSGSLLLSYCPGRDRPPAELDLPHTICNRAAASSGELEDSEVQRLPYHLRKGLSKEDFIQGSQSQSRGEGEDQSLGCGGSYSLAEIARAAMAPDPPRQDYGSAQYWQEGEHQGEHQGIALMQDQHNHYNQHNHYQQQRYSYQGGGYNQPHPSFHQYNNDLDQSYQTQAMYGNKADYYSYETNLNNDGRRAYETSLNARNKRYTYQEAAGFISDDKSTGSSLCYSMCHSPTEEDQYDDDGNNGDEEIGRGRWGNPPRPHGDGERGRCCNPTHTHPLHASSTSALRGGRILEKEKRGDDTVIYVFMAVALLTVGGLFAGLIAMVRV